MKSSPKYIFFFSLLVLLGCSIEEVGQPPIIEDQPDSGPNEPNEPETEVYFTLNTFVRPNDFRESEDWIILHDANGKLLNYKLYTPGDMLVFEAPTDSLTDVISVSYLRYGVEDNTEDYTIRTTTGIEKGYVETLGPYDAPGNDPLVRTGEFDVFINDIPNPFRVASPTMSHISTKNGALGASFSGTGFDDGIEFEIGQVVKYDGLDDYLISILDGNNDLKYHLVSNPDGQDVSLEYTTDFFESDMDISFTLPPYRSYRVNIGGFLENQEFSQDGGYRLHDVISVVNTEVNTNPLKIGYLNMFPKYRTVFAVTFDDYSYSIVKYGNPLEVLEIPQKPNFTITDNSINTFRFNVDIEYNRMVSTWRYREGSRATQDLSITTWTVESPGRNESVVGALPEEILEKYTTLNSDKIEYDNIIFKLPLEGGEFISNHSITIPKE